MPLLADKRAYTPAVLWNANRFWSNPFLDGGGQNLVVLLVHVDVRSCIGIQVTDPIYSSTCRVYTCIYIYTLSFTQLFCSFNVSISYFISIYEPAAHYQNNNLTAGM